MNDEELARCAFRSVFDARSIGEPAGLPDLDRIAKRGRQGNRVRHGSYAAGGAIVAGAVVAGTLGGPGLLGLGGTSGASHARSFEPGAAASAPAPKGFSGSPCTAEQLATAKATTDSLEAELHTLHMMGKVAYASCAALPDGSIGYDVPMTLGPDKAIELIVRAGNTRVEAERTATTRYDQGWADMQQFDALIDNGFGSRPILPGLPPGGLVWRGGGADIAGTGPLVSRNEASAGSWAGEIVSLSRRLGPKPIYVEIVCGGGLLTASPTWSPARSADDGSGAGSTSGPKAPLDEGQLTRLATAVVVTYDERT